VNIPGFFYVLLLRKKQLQFCYSLIIITLKDFVMTNKKALNKKIADYLSKANRTVEEGISLFCEYSDDVSLKSKFIKKKNESATQERMFAHLEKLQYVDPKILQEKKKAALELQKTKERYNTAKIAFKEAVDCGDIEAAQEALKSKEEFNWNNDDLTECQEKIDELVRAEQQFQETKEMFETASTDFINAIDSGDVEKAKEAFVQVQNHNYAKEDLSRQESALDELINKIQEAKDAELKEAQEKYDGLASTAKAKIKASNVLKTKAGNAKTAFETKDQALKDNKDDGKITNLTKALNTAKDKLDTANELYTNADRESSEAIKEAEEAKDILDSLKK